MKYFIKNTEEELEFGDIIAINFEKVLEDGCINIEKEVKFTPALVDLLLDLGVIEEVENKKETIDFYDCDGEDLEEIFDNIEELLARVETLEKEVEKTFKKFHTK